MKATKKFCKVKGLQTEALRSVATAARSPNLKDENPIFCSLLMYFFFYCIVYNSHISQKANHFSLTVLDILTFCIYFNFQVRLNLEITDVQKLMQLLLCQ